MDFAMNYKIHDVTIRSENAAKPHTMPSGYLCRYLKELNKSGKALDFGCGKLRYAEELTNKFSAVTFVDSSKQLERTQIVRGIKTSVNEYVMKNYNGASSVSFENIELITEKYDFILCSNVLSAIPCVDTINNVVSRINLLLKEDGEALIVNQYRSSYFKKYEDGVKHLYGYIHKNSKGSSYYGLLDECTVKKICFSNGLLILDSWSKAGSSYVKVGRN